MYLETYTGNLMKAEVHNSALYLKGYYGVLNGYGTMLNVSQTSPTTISVGTGLIIIHGKTIICDTQTLTLPSPFSPCNLVITVNLLTNTVSYSFEDLSFNPRQDDLFINPNLGIHQMLLYSLTMSNNELNITPTYPIVTKSNGGGSTNIEIYPVNSIIGFTDATNPNTLYPGTTWTQLAAGGRLVIGAGARVSTINPGATLTTTSFTIAAEDMPGHTHTLNHSHTGVAHNHTSTHTHVYAHTHDVSANTVRSEATFSARDDGGSINNNFPLNVILGWGAMQRNHNTGSTTPPRTNARAAADTSTLASQTTSSTSISLAATGSNTAHTHTMNYPQLRVNFWRRDG